MIHSTEAWWSAKRGSLGGGLGVLGGVVDRHQVRQEVGRVEVLGAGVALRLKVPQGLGGRPCAQPLQPDWVLSNRACCLQDASCAVARCDA